MNAAHEVISTFLDNEPFDPRDLSNALNDPDGRAALIDLITLRQIVQPTDSIPAMRVPPPSRRLRWRLGAAGALLLFGLAAGYLVGERRSLATMAEAPPPTRVVQAVPFTPAGGGQ